jgi:hypothetical protein
MRKKKKLENRLSEYGNEIEKNDPIVDALNECSMPTKKVRGDILVNIICPHCGCNNDFEHSFVEFTQISISCSGANCDATFVLDIDALIYNNDETEECDDEDGWCDGYIW